LSDVTEGDVKATAVVYAAGEKTCSIPTLAEFRLRQGAIGTERQQDVNTDKDCRVQ